MRHAPLGTEQADRLEKHACGDECKPCFPCFRESVSADDARYQGCQQAEGNRKFVFVRPQHLQAFQGMDGGCRVWSVEYCAAGHQDIGSGFRQAGARLKIDTSVHFDQGV